MRAGLDEQATDDDHVAPVDRARAAAAMRELDRAYRARLIQQGVIRPGASWVSTVALERQVDALPALALDAAGRAAVSRPARLDKWGAMADQLGDFAPARRAS